ncbi:polyunsaturated fatty acid lipoxygenase ALOX15B-like [Alosa pseudoharengus]|uniref:polyunsaturated fatty acid lipoxygenase ALOX15B-like n=1 Tax=Alosa pseudoharengus TaxID=34774 RepID=UPI003F8B343E
MAQDMLTYQDISSASSNSSPTPSIASFSGVDSTTTHPGCDGDRSDSPDRDSDFPTTDPGISGGLGRCVAGTSLASEQVCSNVSCSRADASPLGFFAVSYWSPDWHLVGSSILRSSLRSAYFCATPCAPNGVYTLKVCLRQSTLIHSANFLQRSSCHSQNLLSFSPLQPSTCLAEYVLKHWKKDEFFGYQLLNGLNPMMIQRCSKLPENFLVTEEMVKDSLNGSNLEHEIEVGNIFLCDYKMLDGLVGNVVHDRQQYHTAPLVLLYCNPQGLMLPIAIQLGQTPGPENPIFLPTDPNHDWLLAKIFVRAAEFSMHESDFHLLRTHLLCEVFTMATLRNIPSIHPLYKLIFPHIRYTLHINILARNQLISENGVLNQGMYIQHFSTGINDTVLTFNPI